MPGSENNRAHLCKKKATDACVHFFYISCRLAKVRNEVFFTFHLKAPTTTGGRGETKGIASIQEELENALHKVTGSETPVMGCGRTDAGVHASSFCAL